MTERETEPRAHGGERDGQQAGEQAGELAGWRAEWQALGDVAALGDQLAERCARDGRRIRRSLYAEAIAAFVSCAIVVGLIVRTRGAPPVTAMCGAILVFNGVWVTRFFTAREGQLRLDGSSLDRFVALTRRRLASDLSLARFAWRANLVMLAMVVPGIAWIVASRLEAYRREPWRALVGIGVAAAIHAGLFAWMRRKRAKLAAEQERFEQLVTRGTLE